MRSECGGRESRRHFENGMPLAKSKDIIQARKMVVKSIEIYNQIKPNKAPKLQNAR
uniref:Uncharacterized protein n=1 Tax=Vibrio parahaemolyticus TaxID=670 RepID=A0A7M1WCY1_VIBPH|nr:hypothetical protein VP351_00020 [Vibrio parahaemolyticus]